MISEDKIKEVEKLFGDNNYISEEDIDPELLQEMVDEGYLREITEDEEDCDCEGFDIKDQMEIVALKEELKRIEVQENPISVVTAETQETEFYKTAMIKAETLGAMFQTLVGFGVDYNNALSLSANIIKDDQELKLAKVATIGQ